MNEKRPESACGALRCIRIITAILAALFIFVAGVIFGSCFAWFIRCVFAAVAVLAVVLLIMTIEC